MSMIDEIEKGLRFQIAGKFGESLRFADEKTGEVSRMIRIRGLGKTYSLSVDTDEDLNHAPKEGTPSRPPRRRDRDKHPPQKRYE